MDHDIKINYSNRGFIYLDDTTTDYGADVSIYESSSAEGPHIWLGIDQPPPDHGGALQEASARAHMSLSQAEIVYAKLGRMIELTKERWSLEEAES